jgi:3-oxoacyl-[acyl-carrier-protein] synthase III
MIKGCIRGISGYLPEHVETLDDVARANPDWDLDRIADKTGIRAWHVAGEHETACDLACAAARRLLERDLVPRDTIDFLIVCTQTPDYLLPANACLLQKRLKLPSHVAAFDFNAGCSGYVQGLQLATALVESQAARNVLLVTADTYSKLVHPRDRTVRSLFGDGAAATLVGPAEQSGPGSIGPFVHGTLGSGAGELIVPVGGFRAPRSGQAAREPGDSEAGPPSGQYLFMNGQAVFSFALSYVPAAMKQLLQRTGTTVDDIDWFVYHQSSRFMLESLAACSHVPAEKMVCHLEQVGNTISASIPLALEAYATAGRIRAGQRLLLAGFGVGFSWGVCLATWG